MSADDFIDTNVFIYHMDTRNAQKTAVASRILRDGAANGRACIRFQVIQETLNTLVRKAAIGFSPGDARQYLDNVLAPLLLVPATVELYQRALDLQTRYRYAFYDSLIVAAALTAGCSRLYTEDMQHGQQIEGLRIENPFL
jgi:predicted nucleic acid-binding protein